MFVFHLLNNIVAIKNAFQMIWLSSQVETFGRVFLYQAPLEKKDNHCNIVNVLLVVLPSTSGDLNDLIWCQLSSHCLVVLPYYSWDFSVCEYLPHPIWCNHHCDIIFINFVFLKLRLTRNAHTVSNHISKRARHCKSRILLCADVDALWPDLSAQGVFFRSTNPSPWIYDSLQLCWEFRFVVCCYLLVCAGTVNNYSSAVAKVGC